MNLWYVARPNEIFIDTDNFARSIKHTAARLAGAIKCGRLHVKNLEFHASRNENHIHTIITLHNEMPAIERATWALILHSDIYRAASTIMRTLYNVPCSDILITPNPFLRSPDAVCECEEKHSSQVMLACPAAFQLRGESVARGFFGLPDNSGWTLEQIAEYIKNQSGSLFE